MANKRTANTLKRKLNDLDVKIWGEDDDKKADELEAQKKQLITLAHKNGLRLISITVADGYALYYEVKRTQRLATFEWLYGGPDAYYSDFGKTVAIPIQTANNRLKTFNVKYL